MSKKNLILIVVLAVLLVVAYIYQGPWQNWKTKNASPKNIFSAIKFKDANKVEIVQDKNSISLEKTGDQWKLSGNQKFNLQKDVMDKFADEFEKLAKAKVEIISSNKSNKKEYSTDEQGISVKLFSNTKLLTNFVVGRSENGGNYISTPDSDKTYFYGYGIKSFLSDTDNWYDKAIFSVNKDGINRIRFQYPDSEFSIEKNKKWEGIKPYKFIVNEKKITKILDIMSNLTAVSIPAQTFKGTGLEKHSVIVSASGKDINNVIMIGDRNADGNYFAKRGDSDNIYLITKEQRDELAKKISDLK